MPRDDLKKIAEATQEDSYAEASPDVKNANFIGKVLNKIVKFF